MSNDIVNSLNNEEYKNNILAEIITNELFVLYKQYSNIIETLQSVDGYLYTNERFLNAKYINYTAEEKFDKTIEFLTKFADIINISDNKSNYIKIKKQIDKIKYLSSFANEKVFKLIYKNINSQNEQIKTVFSDLMSTNIIKFKENIQNNIINKLDILLDTICSFNVFFKNNFIK